MGKQTAAPEQDLKIEYVDPATLRPAPYNPRKITERAKASLKRGIEKFGIVEPFLVRPSDRMLIGGHQRHAIALEMGTKRVPVTFRELSDPEAQALNILLNNVEAQGQWDIGILSNVLSDLDANGFDATLTGFDDTQLESLFTWEPDPEKPIEEDESDPLPLPDVPLTQPGDLIELGRHRLICGDSRDAHTWEALMQGRKADLVWTDPPYNVDYQGGVLERTKAREKIKNDDMSTEDFTQLLRDSLSMALVHSKPGAAWYVCAPGGPENLPFATVLSELKVWRQSLMWVKDRLVLSHADYHARHEPMFVGASPGADLPGQPKQRARRATQAQPLHYGWTPGAPHHFVKDRTIDTVWEVPRPHRSAEHPTMKPVELIRRAIRNSTENGATIIDPFAGSGSTMIAAEQTGRTALMIELDPAYCDVIRTRYDLYSKRRRGVAP